MQHVHFSACGRMQANAVLFKGIPGITHLPDSLPSDRIVVNVAGGYLLNDLTWDNSKAKRLLLKLKYCAFLFKDSFKDY